DDARARAAGSPVARDQSLHSAWARGCRTRVSGKGADAASPNRRRAGGSAWKCGVGESVDAGAGSRVVGHPPAGGGAGFATRLTPGTRSREGVVDLGEGNSAAEIGEGAVLGDFFRRLQEAAPGRAGQRASDADPSHAELGELADGGEVASHQNIDGF